MLIKLPFIVAISCLLTVIHALDAIIDRINTPLADWIDDLCILLLSELDKYGAQVLGASFHVALAYLYVMGIRFIIPTLDSSLLFAGYYLNPAFIITANVLTPALYNSLIVVLPLIAALGLLNKVICYKKIEKGSVHIITSPNEWKMRHNPLEYGIGLVFRIMNKLIKIPNVIQDLYETASKINSWVYSKITQITAFIMRHVQCLRRGAAGQESAQSSYFACFNVMDRLRQTVARSSPADQTTQLWRNPARQGDENPFLTAFDKRQAEAAKLKEQTLQNTAAVGLLNVVVEAQTSSDHLNRPGLE